MMFRKMIRIILLAFKLSLMAISHKGNLTLDSPIPLTPIVDYSDYNKNLPIIIRKSIDILNWVK